MSDPDKPDATAPWTPQPAGDQPAQRQDERGGGPQSVQPEEPTVVVPRPDDPTVAVHRPQEFAHPGYPPSPQHQQPQQPSSPAYPPQHQQPQQPPSPAYPPQHQPAAPQPRPVEYSQGHAPGQQYGGPPAYGQSPYGPQQGGFGQPAQYGHPDHFRHFGFGPQGRSSRRPSALLGGGIGLLAVVIVGLVLVLGFWKPGFFITKKLDIAKAQTGVQQVLTDQLHGYGAKNVKDVTCNNGKNPTVKKGDTFTCEASIDGTKRQVTVTIQDDNGNYEVGRPS